MIEHIGIAGGVRSRTGRRPYAGPACRRRHFSPQERVTERSSLTVHSPRPHQQKAHRVLPPPSPFGFSFVCLFLAPLVWFETSPSLDYLVKSAGHNNTTAMRPLPLSTLSPQTTARGAHAQYACGGGARGDRHRGVFAFRPLCVGAACFFLSAPNILGAFEFSPL